MISGFIVQASDGMDLIKKAAEHHPNLVITDMGLSSVVDGRSAVCEIRKQNRSLKVIFTRVDGSASRDNLVIERSSLEIDKCSRNFLDGFEFLVRLAAQLATE